MEDSTFLLALVIIFGFPVLTKAINYFYEKKQMQKETIEKLVENVDE